MRRFPAAALAAALLLLSSVSSGCAVDRSFFQMDSNSGVPFFGIDLIPRKVSAHTPDSQSIDASSLVLRGQDR